MNAIIHFSRLGKPGEIYTEGLIRDDGIRLDTCTVVPAEIRKSVFQKNGLITGKTVHTIRKHHFYQEWFDIIELIDSNGNLLGCYCDIVTPLEKRGEAYYLQDLCLDLWIGPDKVCIELDWDEFEAAAQQGLLTQLHYEKAIETFQRIIGEVKQGSFPETYLKTG